MTDDVELFVDLTDENREDGVKSFAVFEKGDSLRRFEVGRSDHGGAVIVIGEPMPTWATTSIVLSRDALRKVMRALVRLEFVDEDWNDPTAQG